MFSVFSGFTINYLCHYWISFYTQKNSRTLYLVVLYVASINVIKLPYRTRSFHQSSWCTYRIVCFAGGITLLGWWVSVLLSESTEGYIWTEMEQWHRRSCFPFVDLRPKLFPIKLGQVHNFSYHINMVAYVCILRVESSVAKLWPFSQFHSKDCAT